MSSEKNFHKLCLDLKKLLTVQTSDTSKWKLLKECFDTVKESDFSTTSADYYFLLETLLESLRPTLFTEEWQEKLFDDIFLHGIYHEAFIVLVKKFSESCESYQQKKIIDVLQKFLKGSSLENLILYQCTSHGIWNPNYALLSKIWNDLITFLISLPERIANKSKGDNIPKIFRSNFYVPLLASNIIKVFSILRDKISNGQDCTLEFVGNLLGRLCITGNAEILSKKLCMEFIRHTESDFIWRKLCQNLFKKMPISSLEVFVTHMLFVVPWYGYLEWILGEEAVNTEKLNYLLTVKLITFKHFEQKTILQNIIGYFASSKNRQEEFWKIFKLLLKNWTNVYNLKYQGHEQQIYIAVALMICCSWLKSLKNTHDTKAYLVDILNGTQLRMENPDNVIRTIGMVVGVDLSSVINPDAQKLNFEEISDQKLLEYLQGFKKIPQKPDKDAIFLEEDLKCFKEVESAKKKWETQQLEKNKSEKLNVELLNESDDEDLVPFDMTNDLVLKKPKHPLYLNDCLHGLIEQEDRDWVEQCLNHAEKLITSNSDTLHEFAEEMTKVVLHLENKYNIDDFDNLRIQILVALAANCPLPVVKYLTTEFYAPNYNIQQRLEILSVIAKSAFQLAHQFADSVTQKPEPKENLSSQKAWKAIVEERIASKTRYITKGPKKKLSEPVENLFAPIAGFFFFPLIHGYYKKSKVQVFGEDGYVLGRLIYTLGSVMHSATNSHLASQMAEVFFEFLPCIWNHEETFVREAVLFALITLYTSVPGYLLTSDTNLQSAAYESQKWLQTIIATDLDINCQVKASFALSILVTIIKEELPSIPGISDACFLK